MTAAHCIFNSSGQYVAQTVSPAQGHSSFSGSWNVNGVWTPAGWTSNNCATTVTDSCNQFDVALLRLTPQAGTTFIGGMAYGSYPKADIQGTPSYIRFTTRRHEGYPVCGNIDSPSPCTSRVLWGDTANFFSRNYRYSDLVFDFNSDSSASHSGGPVYGWESNGLFPILFGVHTAAWCTGDCTIDGTSLSNTLLAFPNINYRFSTTWVSGTSDIIYN